MTAGLLDRALSADPANPALNRKRGFLLYEAKDYSAAARHFAVALAGVPQDDGLRVVQARSLLNAGDPAGALAVLESVGKPLSERARALQGIGDIAAAVAEARAVLSMQPDDAPACRLLCRHLLAEDRFAQADALCQDLHARGASNAQMFYNWGTALALMGDRGRARSLMFDPRRVGQVVLTDDTVGGDPGSFLGAIADDIEGNRNRLSHFPDDEANRGSSRVDNLFTCARPGLVERLVAILQDAAARFLPQPLGAFDPWPAARPAVARLRPWGLLQRGDAYEEGHIHPSGWLSGVLYLRVPPGITDADDGPGCIEFGPSKRVRRSLPGFGPVQRYRPRQGLLLLSPSFFHHRTIPSHLDASRISVAFDMVPETRGGASGGDSAGAD